MNKHLLLKALPIIFVLQIYQAYGWIYPEHRKIAIVAIQNLKPEHRLPLDKLWKQARTGYENRLTENVIEPAQGVNPTQLDYASWAAIAGDHSCSSYQMLNSVLHSDWILNVASIAAKLQVNINKSESNSQHNNAIRDADNKLQRTDLDYATRAGANNVHFLLGRPYDSTSINQYLIACLKAGAPLNALGAYSWFHISAMNKAARFANENLTELQKSELILSALSDEAFALHFLQDGFASGHVAGTWGTAAVRKGTHDYYNENGLEIVTWDGKREIAMGDAYMRSKDETVASIAVKLSLEQFIEAATGRIKLHYETDIFTATNKPDTFDVCTNTVMPSRKIIERNIPGKVLSYEFLTPVLKETPVPGLSTGLGELPRFRSEVGVFAGFSTALDLEAIAGGFGPFQTKAGLVGGLEANARFGIGLDGVLNKSGDGLAFIQAGVRLDANSTNQFSDDFNDPPVGAISSAIPGRSAISFRIRLPFWLIPGDLLLATPFLMFTAPKTLTKMGVIAVNGGLVPWQSGMSTPIGRFQFVLGREVGVSLYGISNPKKDVLLIISSAGTDLQFVGYGSTKLDFPILEYRPFRTFSNDQALAGILQLTAGCDIPRKAKVLSPSNQAFVSLKTIWYVGVRFNFNWRHYF